MWTVKSESFDSSELKKALWSLYENVDLLQYGS